MYEILFPQSYDRIKVQGVLLAPLEATFNND